MTAFLRECAVLREHLINTAIALLTIAIRLEQAVSYAGTLPGDFWTS